MNGIAPTPSEGFDLHIPVLVIGFFSRISALLIGLMLVSFLIAMGPEWWPESGPAYSKNFILLTLCALLVVSGSGRFARYVA